MTAPSPAGISISGEQEAAGSFVDLYWLPVGAGTMSRVRAVSLGCWEAVAAALSRRPRAKLVHSALKLRPADGITRTVEMTPVFQGEAVAPAMTGPVGFRWAGRSRFFRYQLTVQPIDALPDEAWTVVSARLTADGNAAERVLALAPGVPAYTWGRRARGTSEMWTSDSAIAWILVRAGIDLDGVTPPAGSRAPGWYAGIQVASRKSRPRP